MNNEQSNNQIVPLFFGDMPARIIIDGNNEPWWVVKDVCDILEHTNPTMAINMLDDDERTKKSLGRQGETWLISESGLYTLIIRSNKPQAKPFRRWVTHEVLPTIRKTGGYMMPGSDHALVAAVETRVMIMVETALARMSDQIVATLDERLSRLQFNRWQGSPAVKFLQRYCEVASHQYVAKADLYELYSQCHQENGWYVDCKAHFFANLYRTVDECYSATKTINGKRVGIVRGLGLKEDWHVMFSEDSRAAATSKRNLRELEQKSRVVHEEWRAKFKAESEEVDRLHAEEVAAIRRGGLDGKEVR